MTESLKDIVIAGPSIVASTERQKILVGIPAFDGVVAEAQQSIFGMVYRAGRDLPNLDVAIHIGYKKEQFRARNNIVDAAIANDMDYILMLDDDMIVPHNLIQKLIEHDKDVVGALYYQRGGMYHPVIMRRKSHEKGLHTADFIDQSDPIVNENKGLHQVDVIGGGCMLFKTDVFRSILQPYFETERILGTDISICGRLQDAGHEIWVDTNIELGHVGEKKIITSRSIPMVDRLMAPINNELAEDVMGYLGMHKEEFMSAMDRAATKKARQDAWGENRESWEDIKAYYQDHRHWHIINLAYYNLYKPDPYKEWGIVEGAAMLNKDSHVLDYGAGLGHLSVPLAKRGIKVACIDVMDSPTMTFLDWRSEKHKLDTIGLYPEDKEVPHPKRFPNGFITEKFDGAFCISVMDHLTKPYETVTWIRDQLKPGAFFVCEWAVRSGEDEPQHLDRYDVTTFQQWMHEIGFVTSPEYSWLFFYQG